MSTLRFLPSFLPSQGRCSPHQHPLLHLQSASMAAAGTWVSLCLAGQGGAAGCPGLWRCRPDTLVRWGRGAPLLLLPGDWLRDELGGDLLNPFFQAIIICFCYFMTMLTLYGTFKKFIDKFNEVHLIFLGWVHVRFEQQTVMWLLPVSWLAGLLSSIQAFIDNFYYHFKTFTALLL